MGKDDASSLIHINAIGIEDCVASRDGSSVLPSCRDDVKRHHECRAQWFEPSMDDASSFCPSFTRLFDWPLALPGRGCAPLPCRLSSRVIGTAVNEASCSLLGARASPLRSANGTRTYCAYQHGPNVSISTPLLTEPSRRSPEEI